MPNSKHYLLGFWACIVNPLIYLKDKAPPGLESCIQQIAILYIDSRLLLAEAPPDCDIEDPLEDEASAGGAHRLRSGSGAGAAVGAARRARLPGPLQVAAAACNIVLAA